jgi:hypothetical protein
MQLVKLALTLGALLAIVLGAHALYVRMNAVQGILPAGKEGADLFLVGNVPSTLAGLVDWFSSAGLSSWDVPVVFILAGCALLWVVWYRSRRSRNGLRRFQRPHDNGPL